MPYDYRQALERLTAAAAQGDTSAPLALGVMYGLGLGVAQDYGRALDCYRQGAMAGEARAQSNLGWMYGTGRGVPQDFVQAYAWYNIAAAAGEDTARTNRDIVVTLMTPAQLEEAQRISRELFDKIEAGRAHQV